MADEPVVAGNEPSDTFDENEEFEKWLAAVDEDEDAQETAEGEHAQEDDKALKEAKKAQAMFAKHVKDERVEKKIDAFLEDASDTEKELFAIFRKGDEDDKQIDRLIELVKTKANVAEGTLAGEEEVEDKAAELAQEMIGAGPLKRGARVKPDLAAELAEATRRGDVHAAFIEFSNAPETPAGR